MYLNKVLDHAKTRITGRLLYIFVGGLLLKLTSTNKQGLLDDKEREKELQNINGIAEP